ncbi:hypothetical protein AAC387_Pa06g2439 [Persea americana]
MDKTWINCRNKLRSEYTNGVRSFIKFAIEHMGEQSKICCPCLRCMNVELHSYPTVQEHLLFNGIMTSYTAWIHHGEQMPMNVEGVHDDDSDDEGGSVQGGISDTEDNPHDELPELLEDIYRGVLMDDDLGDLGSGHGFDSVGQENVQKFEKLLKDAQRALYPAMLAGPVQYRWMYPIDRQLGTLKRFVRNRARPEGSIVEAYIVKECLTFCSISEVTSYLEEHKNLLMMQSSCDIDQRQQQEFPKWFEKRMNELRSQQLAEATDELWTEADPTILAEYVATLLRKDKPAKDLQSHYTENLVEFLSQDHMGAAIEMVQMVQDLELQDRLLVRGITTIRFWGKIQR